MLVQAHELHASAVASTSTSRRGDQRKEWHVVQSREEYVKTWVGVMIFIVTVTVKLP